jgi:hypothetical protein
VKTFTMYDAVDVHALPVHTQLTLGYVDGRDTSGHYAAVKARFPNAFIIPVTVTGEHLAAKIGDVEKFDMKNEQGAQWALDKVRAGEAPTLYTQLSNWAALREAVARLKFPPGPPVSYMIAAYDNVAKVPRGAVGKQFSTGRYDTSIVNADWPGVLPKPLNRWVRQRNRRLVMNLSALYTPLVSADRHELELVAKQVQRIDHL